MMRQFGEAAIVMACAIACICLLLAAGVDWGSLPQYPEGMK